MPSDGSLRDKAIFAWRGADLQVGPMSGRLEGRPLQIERSFMKRLMVLALCTVLTPSVLAQRARSGGQPAAGAAQPYDWTTDGGDNQRTGWNKNEKILTKDNIKNHQLVWKVSTGNQVRALHALMPALVIGRLTTASGVKEVAFVSGISDNLYAIDVAAGTMLWKKHWDYQAPAGRGGGAGQDPASLGFLQPGGSSDVP